MRKLAVAVALLQFLVLPLLAADAPPKECVLCVGAVSDLTNLPSTPLPLLVRVAQDDLAARGAAFDALPLEQRKRITLVVEYSVAADKDPLLDVEAHTNAIVEWAKQHGPFDALGVAAHTPDAATAAYAIKRLSVAAQGQNAAMRIALAPTSVDDLKKLYETGAQTYFDIVLAEGDVKPSVAWLVENDPAKKVQAIVAPQSPNALFDLGRALADGASRAYLTSASDAATLAALASFDVALAGDWAYDPTAQTSVLDAKGNAVAMPVLTFVRGEDLRTIVIPQGDANAATIVSLPSDRFVDPRRIDAGGERAITDVGSKGGRFLIGAQPVKQPFAFALNRSEKIDANVTKESIEIATKRGITVEEIIRNHQAYKSFEESIEPRYIARNTTKLRFNLQGGEGIEAAIAGDYFSDRNGRADWVWQDFYLNGVRWKYGRIPELPLIQPEKVTQLPLDIHLTNEYRYQLIRETDLGGYHVYEVRFEPPPNAPAELPLYRGTVWIDAHTWARVRINLIQLNLTGEILSNEERVDFQPFARDGYAPLTQADVAKLDPRAVVWLPLDVHAQQVISAAGRASVVQRSTEMANFRINPDDYDRRLKEAQASDSRMVRETEAGLRYLEKRGDGERVVKEGYDTSQVFMLGGVHHDEGLDYPVVPLGGIDYFNFNLANRGIQTNVFFAGVILAANATHPNVGNTRTNVGVDFFGIAIPTTNTIFRDGEERKEEAVKSVPLGLYFRAGHPILGFGKIDFAFGTRHETFQRAEDTASNFVVPADTFELTPSVDASYARWGYTVSASFDYTRRTSWKPWGNLAEYSDDQRSFLRYGASFGKSFYLPKFQRLSISANYLDGQRLDRFSKYELGFFGAQRIHGIQSGSVRAERAILTHVSYGFVFSDQFRLEAFYDHGLLDDKTAGYQREPFQGIGLAGQTVGPYGTLLRLDLGKTVGRNAQDGFVANVVFLKLF
ncbi:MAG: hypothetical protein JOZ54_11735 [Acidobacteria bacterium]|nr:hypothetical protein [Acidobacteriota bacterium]